MTERPKDRLDRQLDTLGKLLDLAEKQLTGAVDMDFDFVHANELAEEIKTRLDELLEMGVDLKSRGKSVEELTFSRIWHGEQAFLVDWLQWEQAELAEVVAEA